MKGRQRIGLILALLGVVFISAPGFSKNKPSPSAISASLSDAKLDTSETAESKSSHVYVVRRGDNLIQIARAHKTTVTALKAANGLKSSRIKAGQTLRLPAVISAPPAPKPLQAQFTPSAPAERFVGPRLSRSNEQKEASEDEQQAMRLRLVEAGFKMIGIRYRRSGNSEKTGFDCSGLVKTLFSKFDIELPRSSREQFKQGEKIDRDKLEAGDLVFFSSGGSRPTHVGVYIGDDKFLHAARKARQVVVSDLNKIWYTMRYLGARRISDLWEDEEDPGPEKE